MAHGEVYWNEFGWDTSMEALVARIVADYAAGHDPRREAAWIAELEASKGRLHLLRDRSRRPRLRQAPAPAGPSRRARPQPRPPPHRHVSRVRPPRRIRARPPVDESPADSSSAPVPRARLRADRGGAATTASASTSSARPTNSTCAARLRPCARRLHAPTRQTATARPVRTCRHLLHRGQHRHGPGAHRQPDQRTVPGALECPPPKSPLAVTLG